MWDRVRVRFAYALKCIDRDHFKVLSQSAAAYTDPDNGINFVGITDAVHQITYGYVFPPVGSTTTPNEFIGEIVAPIANKWAGVSPGGGMIKQLLLVAWPNGNAIVRSARYATYDVFCNPVNVQILTLLLIGIMCNRRTET